MPWLQSYFTSIIIYKNPQTVKLTRHDKNLTTRTTAAEYFINVSAVSVKIVCIGEGGKKVTCLLTTSI